MSVYYWLVHYTLTVCLTVFHTRITLVDSLYIWVIVQMFELWPVTSTRRHTAPCVTVRTLWGGPPLRGYLAHDTHNHE